MLKISMSDASAQLSKLVEAIESGREQEVIITRSNRAAAKLVPVSEADVSHRIGGGKLGFGWLPSFTLAELNASDDEVAALFEKSES